MRTIILFFTLCFAKLTISKILQEKSNHNDNRQVDIYDCTVSNMDRNPENAHCAIKYPNGDLYKGELANHRRNGFGRMMYVNGDYYEGQWVDGFHHGQGTFHKNGGEYYEGQFFHNMKHGFGKLTLVNGEESEGEFIENKLEGQGRKVFTNGDIYVGQFHKGVMQGVGTLSFANGNVYNGDFEDNFMHGIGTLTYAKDGSFYDGTFQYNRRSREGVMRWLNGESYSGEWNLDLYHGYGTFQYANGNTYEGEYKEGRRHGEGIYTWMVKGPDGMALGSGTVDPGSGITSGGGSINGGNGAVGTNQNGFQQMLQGDAQTQKIQVFTANGAKLDPASQLHLLKSISDSGFLSSLFVDNNNANVGVKRECEVKYIGAFKSDKKHGFGILKYCRSGIEFKVDFSRDTMYSNSVLHKTTTHSAGTRMEGIIRSKKKGAPPLNEEE